ncbi:RNA methyltransferase [Paenibacillus sp. PDC88]|uniref:TrmH family RNA methyltransferase n=1 Tax=Paenibacillus sp. PDC88 TaxID=1884375 RepID=UPI0008990DBA|nr:RNA methyltransferase [Paenibacillus sp. PDC88]SDX49004.1 RNA methyltransferase, TrmH family [Paenibacillus sp. PDC88]
MEIVSVHNPRVKEWAQLLDKKYRTRQNKYMIEGIHLVQEALSYDADIECIAYDMDKGIPGELTGYADSQGRVEWIPVSAAIIEKCTDTVTPQPVFAIVRKDAAGLSIFLDKKDSLIIVLDRLQDPGNVGTIIRSADAAGADGVIVGRGSADIYNPKTIRSTMGSFFHLPVVEADLSEVLPRAKAEGVTLVSTSLAAESSCYDYDFRGAKWLVIGNEGSGVSEEVSRLVDDAIIIPSPGQAESLNAAMAATILMFEAMRQRHYSA